MGNGQHHPDEDKFAKRMGKDYIVDQPPEGAKVAGEDSDDEQSEESFDAPADEVASD